MSKEISYYEALIKDYEATRDRVKMLQTRTSKGDYLTSDEGKELNSSLNHLQVVLWSMGVEFPNLFARYKILRDRSNNESQSYFDLL